MGNLPHIHRLTMHQQRVKSEIVWDDVAKNDFKKIIQFVKKESIVNADRLWNELVTTVAKIPKHPKMFPADKYKINKYSNYRAFEIHPMWIVNWVGTNSIRIVRISSTYQKNCIKVNHTPRIRCAFA